MIIGRSAVENTPYGTAWGDEFPGRGPARPLARYAANALARKKRDASKKEVWMIPPLPVVDRRNRAPSIAIAAHIPAPLSTVQSATRSGSPPGSPFPLIWLERACASPS